MRIRKTDSRAANYVTKAKGAVATANKYSAPQYSGNFHINSTQQSNGWPSETIECATGKTITIQVASSRHSIKHQCATRLVGISKMTTIMTSLAWWPGNKVSSKIKQHQSIKQGNGHLKIPLTTPPKLQNTEQQIPLTLVTMTSGQWFQLENSW